MVRRWLWPVLTPENLGRELQFACRGMIALLALFVIFALVIAGPPQSSLELLVLLGAIVTTCVLTFAISRGSLICAAGMLVFAAYQMYQDLVVEPDALDIFLDVCWLYFLARALRAVSAKRVPIVQTHQATN